MGWWNTPENPEIMTGDAALDTVRHFLKDFTHEFQGDLSRKPTLEELEYALSLAFRVNLDSDIVEGFDELEVKQVAIKTSKRPKRQKVLPGDIFSYKLDNGNFGFGRIISNVPIGSIAEIFDYFSEQPIFDHSKKDKWLFPPIPIESYSLLEVGRIGEWRIIERDPNFTPGEKFKSLRYVYGSSPSSLTATDIYGNKNHIEASEAKGIPEYYAYDDFYFKKLIKDHLSKNTNNTK